MIKGLFDIGKAFVSLKPDIGQIWNVTKYSACFFAGRFPLRPFYQPLSIGVYITFHCNLSCPFCFNEEVNKKENFAKELTYEDFKAIIENPRTKNAFRVSYVGGEPLLNKDLFKFIDLAWKNKKLSMFPTNGLLIENRLDEFKTTRLYSLQLSIYEEYAERQIRNVELLKKAGTDANIIFSRYVTTEGKSLDYMEEVVRMAREVGVKEICFQNFVATRPEDEHLIIYDDNKDVLDYLKAFKKKHDPTLKIMLPGILNRNVKDKFCYCLYTTVFVAKGGVVSSCPSIIPDAIYGNAFDDGFWGGQEFIDHRRFFHSRFPVKEECRNCYENAHYVREII